MTLNDINKLREAHEFIKEVHDHFKPDSYNECEISHDILRSKDFLENVFKGLSVEL